MALMTALLFGIMSSVAKLISADGLSQMSVMAYRTVFAVVALGLWFSFSGKKDLFRIPNPMVSKYAMLGFFSLVCNATGFMMSCVYLSVPQAVILHYMFPLTTMAASCLVSKERPTGLEVLAGVLVVAGLFLLLRNSLIAIAAGTILYMVLVQVVFVV